MIPRALAGALIAAGTLLAVAAPASAAPALEPLRRCYVSVDAAHRELVEVRATGFAGGSVVDASVDGVRQSRQGVQANAEGRIAGEVPAPFHPAGQRRFRLDLVQRDDPSNAVRAWSAVSALSVVLRPARARPSDLVRYRGRGFVGKGAVYAHYLHGGRVRRTVRLASPRRACGVFSVRAKQLPVPRPRPGTWLVQVDQERRYTPAPEPVHVRLTIEVRRRSDTVRPG